MRIKTEALLLFGAAWCLIAGALSGGVDGLSLLGFFPLLLRGLLETAREIAE